MKKKEYLKIQIFEPENVNSPLDMYWLLACYCNKDGKRLGNFMHVAHKPTLENINEQLKELGETL